MLVQECKLAEAVHGFELFLDDAIHDNLYTALLDNKEARPHVILLEDSLSLVDHGVEHIVLHVFQLSLAQVVKDEVVLETR